MNPKSHSATVRLLIKLTLLLLFLGGAGSVLYGQTARTISGKVIDDKGEIVPGAFVLVKGTNNGTMSDAEGRYTLSNVPPDAVISASCIGFDDFETAAGTKTTLNIVLKISSEQLEEVVLVAYGAQKKVSVTGSIAAVQTKDIAVSSSPNLSAALSGKLPGLTTIQSNGRPGGDDIALYLRGAGTTNGASPLILIDGVPRSNISNLDPNEIASISILKDASATAVFGVRGANGVILITTRRGEEGSLNLSARADYSLQSFITEVDRVHSWEFAELRNQASRNDGVEESMLPYTQYMIDRYKAGDDPVFYPDRDVWREMFYQYAPQQRVNVNASGGSKQVKFFVNVGFVNQGGLSKNEGQDVLGYDPTFNLKRYSFRSNLDYQVAPSFKLSVNVGTYLDRVGSPTYNILSLGSMTAFMQQLVLRTWETPASQPGPVTVPGYGVPVNEIVCLPTWDYNAYALANSFGFLRETKIKMNTSLIADWKLDRITKGLNTRFMVSYDSFGETNLNGVRTFDTYAATVGTSEGSASSYIAARSNTNGAITLSKSVASRYYLNLQYSLNYARTFAGKHDVTGMLLLQRDNWQNAAADLPYNILGFSGRFTYGYDNRYFAEFNAGYNGSEQFAKAHRFGFFPAVSASWVVSNEDFLQGNPVVTSLKLRVSYGKVGNDSLGSDRFLYISELSSSTSGPMSSLGHGNYIVQGRMGNEELSWEIAHKQNYGLDIQLFQQFNLSVDVFREFRDHILLTRGTVPELQGVPLTNLPKMNMGKVLNQGFELDASWNKRFSPDCRIILKGNFAYNRNKQIAMDEAILPESYAYRHRKEGYSIGQCWGYKIDYSNGNGYINTQEELDNLPTYNVGGTPRLGDFKYVDMNGDNIIDEKDLSPIGYSKIPRITYGFTASGTWKGFDATLVISGIAQASMAYNIRGVTEFAGNGFYTGPQLHAWTKERYEAGEKILYPALGVTSGCSITANSYFIMDRSFCRLKSAEIGYTFPKSFMRTMGLQSLRLYVNANNLFTIKNMPIYHIDPEQSMPTAYPLTRTVTMGANISFK